MLLWWVCLLMFSLCVLVLGWCVMILFEFGDYADFCCCLQVLWCFGYFVVLGFVSFVLFS